MSRRFPSLAVRLGLDSGVHRLLETPLSINGAEGSTILRFAGSQAAAAGVPEYGGAVTLALQAGTVPTYGVVAPPLGALDGAVTFAGGGYFQAPNNTVGDLTTEDLAIEVLMRKPSGNAYHAGHYSDASARGWMIYTWTTDTLRFYLRGAGGFAEVATAALTPGAWVYALGFVGKVEASTNGSRAYVWGAESGSGANFSAVGNITVALPLEIGRSTTSPSSMTLGYLGVHARAAWHQTGAAGPAEWAAIAKARAALLLASRPSFSTVPSTSPTTAGSTSPVYQQRRLGSGADQLLYMDAGAATFDRIVDANGRAHVGHLVEIARPNIALQSQVAGTSRTAVNASVAASNSDTAPDGTVTADTLTASADNGYLKQAYAAITAVSRTESYWIRRNGAGNVAGKLQIVKTSNASVIAEVAFTATALWQQVQINGVCVLNDTETRLVINTSGESLFIWQEDLVAGDYAGSPVVTTTAAVTAAASSLKYSIANCFPRSEGSLVGALLCRSFTPDRARVFASLDDGSANNRIELFTTATTGLLSALSRKAAGTDGDVVHTALGSVFDNKPRPFLLTWNAAELALWVRDPTTHQWSVVRDATLTPIAGATLTTLCIGSDNAIANHSGPGGYLLADWAVCPQHFDHPSHLRRADSISWEGM